MANNLFNYLRFKNKIYFVEVVQLAKKSGKIKKIQKSREFITERELERLIWEEHLRYLKLHKEHEKEIRYIG